MGVCEGCIFANHKPDEVSCMIYAHPTKKPESVYIEGKPCKYRRTREDAKKLMEEAGNDIL